jgi:glycosyltransferase involved in cell wall biosynthesis
MVDVSVIVLAYNRDRFVMDAVNSVLNQTLPMNRYEIIVVTNLASVERMVGGLVDRVVRHDDARGGYARGVEVSNGELVAFLDDDDMFASGKLEHVVGVFGKDKSLGFYHHNVAFIDVSGIFFYDDAIAEYWRTKVFNERVYAKTLEEKEKLVEYLITEVHRFRKDLRDPFYWLGFNSSSIVVRRDLAMKYLDALGRMYIAQDNLHFIEALLSNYAVMHEPIELTNYRLHSVGKASFGGAEKGMKQWNDMQVLSEVVRGTWLEKYVDFTWTELFQFDTLLAYARSVGDVKLIEYLLRKHYTKLWRLRKKPVYRIMNAILGVPILKKFAAYYALHRIR